MARRSRRPWLRYLTGNLLAATAVCLPLGVALVFAGTKLGLPLWPAVLLTPALVALDGWRFATMSRSARARWLIRLGIGAAIGVALTLLEAPWRDAYDDRSFWQHSLGMAVGGALSGVWVCVANWLALRLEGEGPFRDLVPSAPLMMTVVAVPGGAFAGYIVSIFSVPLWTFTVADLRPGFVSVPVWITMVTAAALTPLGLLLGHFTDLAQGESDGGGARGG